ncbi:extensin [Azospirillum brasilense]|uniref:Extensin n=1 Tax=Azospirillum brasilense TaxID=192 RepID=A0A4D8QRL8_AZOBR|nr:MULTISPECIES: extensin family protein [Azospirillum]MDW7553309.1 extensin family protein [Azospirillum brasilense]MDW7593312.1 extensin family protein [Azospirillum brasilense]MDW7628628.1 extensin family protein [Azospirillum brasilense]MDX5955277.1 extensin family protein [Azospirillum brasilense]QCO11994.1 extensin [Azospirillum brasilense]
MARFLRWVTALLFLAVMGGAAMVGTGVVTVPPRYDPWAPLDIGEVPNLLTRLKLSRLDGAPRQCHAVLGDAGLRFSPVTDRQTGPGCGLTDAVQVSRSAVAFNGGFTVTCPLAAAWMLFETHTLQPAAQRHFGQRVARVRHLGSYACRNVYGRAEGRRSEHATANALDIAGFTLADGTTIALPGDWTSADGRKRAFLREVRDGACEVFRAVLGPDYNEAHRDHFHLDMGPYRVCR